MISFKLKHVSQESQPCPQSALEELKGSKEGPG